jgi:hypothetical protein
MKGAIGRVGGLGAVVAAFLTFTSLAFATTTYTEGPQSWSSGDTTGRYRAEAGDHTMKVNDGCGSQIVTVELRVDVIDKPDLSVGTRNINCGGSATLYSGVDSYNSAYRGHFMQSHESWYGRYQDVHE